MIKNALDIGKAVARLNALVEMDPDGMKSVCEARTPVNPEMAEHKDLPVLVAKQGEQTFYLMGPLGLVNYLFGMDQDAGMGAIAGIFEVACGKCGLLGNEGQVVGDVCGACGGEIELGDLIEFTITPQGREAIARDEQV